jgi:hypothetical protein
MSAAEDTIPALSTAARQGVDNTVSISSDERGSVDFNKERNTSQ